MKVTVLNLEGSSFHSIMVGYLPGSGHCLLGRSFSFLDKMFNAYLGCLV